MGFFVFLVVSILCPFFGKCFCVSPINKLSNLELAHYQNKQKGISLQSAISLWLLRERGVFHHTFFVVMYICLSAFVASGTDVMPGRAIRPMFMSIPSSFSYFLMIPKCFQNTIVRIVMIFRRKPRM